MPANVVSVAPQNHHLKMQNNNNNDSDLEQQQQQQQSSPQSSYNSSYGSNSGKNLINTSNITNSSLNNTSIASSIPGGVVTTQNISTVIKPQGNNKSLQFVKIQTPELSKKAVEQIKLAEETKISKSKIKEVEEQEWHNQLLDWKSRRKQNFGHSTGNEGSNNLYEDSQEDPNGGRKVKTFAEMLEQRAKSGNRLGSFHLQRYIGTDEEESAVIAEGNEDDRQPDSGGSGGDVDDEVDQDRQDFANHSTENNSKSRSGDSDYEAHSSTSSGFNQLDSKSPSSPEMLAHESITSKSLSFSAASKCDNNNIITNNRNGSDLQTQDQPDSNSMSFLGKVEEEEIEHLNSTFKQGLVIDSKPPAQVFPLKQNTPVKPSIRNLDIDFKSKQFKAPRSEEEEEEESDNSGFGEEEEEEEEEQKHLQRIAFEAKLKAFERLTVPGTKTPPPKPKPPTRMVPKPPIIAASVAPIIQNKKPTACIEKSTSFEDRQKIQQTTRNFKEKPCSLDERVPTNQSFVQDNRLQTTLNNLAAQSPVVQLPEQIPETLKHSSQPQQLPEPLLQNSPVQPLPPQLQQPITNQSLYKIPPAPQMRHQNSEQPPPLVNIKNSTTIPIVPPAPQVVEMVHKPRNAPIQQQQQQPVPLPTSPVKNNHPLQPNQKKSNRDDKDGTVLSVSGKKRCSSCKEELGRGAAAFVVESLSLVYHTNCFRCSVCHANLSNGFRGVDVRVHAGALHCQNCYSRDGLNFSRV